MYICLNFVLTESYAHRDEVVKLKRDDKRAVEEYLKHALPCLESQVTTNMMCVDACTHTHSHSHTHTHTHSHTHTHTCTHTTHSRTVIDWYWHDFVAESCHYETLFMVQTKTGLTTEMGYVVSYVHIPIWLCDITCQFNMC